MTRRISRSVDVGGVKVGGGAPVSIQSMCNTDTRDVSASLAQIERLADAGCQIIRLTVPDAEAAKGFGEIKKRCPLPMVADIHFDYKMALAAMDAGADKIRINPGNIGSEEKVRAVFEKAKACKVPIRIGVNSGSLERDIIEKYGGVTAEGICESALKAAEYARSFGFEDLVISLKCSDVQMNHEATLLFAQKSDLPLHIGLTEAGAGRLAEVKSSAALGALLLAGVGDTMRVSLTGDPVREVELAKQILAATGIRRAGIDFVSCPTCGRTQVDLESIASRIEKELTPYSEKLAKEGRFIRLAVMGCAVNGPGEARSADLGVACGRGEGLIIKAGEIVKKVPEDKIAAELINMIKSL